MFLLCFLILVFPRQNESLANLYMKTYVHIDKCTLCASIAINMYVYMSVFEIGNFSRNLTGSIDIEFVILLVVAALNRSLLLYW